MPTKLGRPGKLLRGRLILLVIAMLAAIVLLPVVSCGTAEQKSPEPQKSSAPAPSAAAAPGAPSAPLAIPLADIASRASDASNYLVSLSKKFEPGSTTATIKDLLPAVMKKIYAELANTEDLLEQHPTLTTLQLQQERWKQLRSESSEWLEILTKQSNGLQQELKSLDAVQTRWVATLRAARDAKAPDFVVLQVEATLKEISSTQSSLSNQLDGLLALQARVQTAVSRCEKTLARIDDVQKNAMSGIMIRDSPQLTSFDRWTAALAELPSRTQDIAAAYWASIVEYSSHPSRDKTVHISLFAVLTLLFLAARRRSRQWQHISRTASPAVAIFNHPYAAALLITLAFITSQLSPVNGEVKHLFQVGMLVPMIVLIRPLIDKKFVSAIYVLGLMFAFDALDEIFAESPRIEQVVFMIAVLACVALVIWFLWHLRAVRKSSDFPYARLFQSSARSILAILLCGLIAAMLGYMRLANLIVPGILGGGVIALSLYASVLVVNGVAVYLLHVWPLKKLGAVANHHALLEGRIYRILLVLAVWAWGVRYLNYLGLLGPAQSIVNAVLDARFERGSVSISPRDVLVFFITVWVAYLLSAFIRFVLQEDVYSRVGIASGKSYAYSSLLHYFIITLGFIAAIAALGVNLSKLTVMTGALGVGIGLGLQGMVNNFVSGLILLLERPLHVGDTVEVGDLLGVVRRIGIRASTVHTGQGADIIVPNSQLVSEKVTNWTLSDKLRRIDLPVGVSYDSVPNEVKKVLEAVALAHPQILRDPAPQALFMGYGDSSLNFELRAWTARFDDWWQIRSDLVAAVYDAVRKAGMAFPFPQREVRILGDPGRGTVPFPDSRVKKQGVDTHQCGSDTSHFKKDIE
jgi:potassium-dependent mechanosensitive channel